MGHQVDVDAFAQAVGCYARVLGDFQDEINALNVYPVPDGDTGTNLRLTMEAACKDLDGSADPCQTLIRGSLMGARGNSGVITSQILRGFCEVVGTAGGLSTVSLAEGLRRGTEMAYQAVTQPQEGTILTVVREAAEAAEAAEREGDALAGALDRTIQGARSSLERTPDLLPILAQAGVVDAGGRGLVLLLEAMHHSLHGAPLPEPSVPARSPADAVGQASHPEGSLEFAFEVQFLFEVTDAKADEYRDLLDRYGDCVLVVGNAGLYNVHVHTNQVGAVIEEAIERGRPRQIDVQYLEGQVAERTHEAAVLARMAEAAEAPDGPLDEVGVVAVAAGEGLLEIFRSLGVRGLVHGGQTLNPSAEELIVGIRAAHATNVVILPNNKNVIGAAKTAAALAVDEGVVERVEVVESHSPLQAFTALVSMDPDRTFDENIAAMRDQVEDTKHGEVAHAVRSTETPAGPVIEGQCLGLADGQVVTIADDAQDAVLGVLGQMLADGDSLVTLVYGAEVDEWSAHELGKRVEEAFAVEVDVHHGDQPHYPYLIGVE